MNRTGTVKLDFPDTDFTTFSGAPKTGPLHLSHSAQGTILRVRTFCTALDGDSSLLKASETTTQHISTSACIIKREIRVKFTNYKKKQNCKKVDESFDILDLRWVPTALSP